MGVDSWVQRKLAAGLQRIVGRLAGARRRLRRAEARRFNAAQAPELPRAFHAFLRHQQISAHRQPLKGRDLWLLLEQTRPSRIVELGSGTTSAVFALWARRQMARYTAYEHHEGWAAVTEQCLAEAGLIPDGSPVRLEPVRTAADGNSTGFVTDLPTDADFVYVDGPPCVLPSGRKVPNDDVTRLLDAGGRPAAIVVDGRVQTVDLILRHRIGREYAFSPGYEYCVDKQMWLRGVMAGEHSVFLRRPTV